jgi:hypothetical protein
MKAIPFLLFLALATGCSRNEEQVIAPVPEVNYINTNSPEAVIPAFELKKFPSVMDMLRTANEYREDNKTLVLLSENPLSIQVSAMVHHEEPGEYLSQKVKRDMVYVLLQAFAQTDVDVMTITSVPLAFTKHYPNGKYLKEHQLKMTVNREMAGRIMEKYLHSKNYKKLFRSASGDTYVPDQTFEKLLHEDLDNVYADLAQK